MYFVLLLFQYYYRRRHIPIFGIIPQPIQRVDPNVPWPVPIGDPSYDDLPTPGKRVSKPDGKRW